MITGGAGFIGSHLTDLLLEAGYDVRILDALLHPVHTSGVVPDYVPQEDVEFVLGDVRDRAAWESALEGVDSVVHLAAYQDYLPDFSTFLLTNTVSTALLYEVIVERNLPIQKIVVASSQSVYGEAKYLCLNEMCELTAKTKNSFRYPDPRSDSQLQKGEWEIHCTGCGGPLQWLPTDEAVTNPHSPYAISKLSQELIALILGARYEIPSTCLRYSIVQGPRQSFRNAYSGVLRIFAQRIFAGQPPVCYEDGAQIRDYVSVFDAVRATKLLLEDKATESQVFNVGGDRVVTVKEYAHLVANRAGVSIEPQIPGLYRFGDSRHVVSSVEKLKARGWSPRVPMQDIVDGYIEWASSQPGFGEHYQVAEDHMREVGTIRQIAAPA